MIGAKIKRGILPKALWWDTGDFSSNSNIPPYHYVRTLKLNDEYDILLCGGEDHLTGDIEIVDLHERIFLDAKHD